VQAGAEARYLCLLFCLIMYNVYDWYLFKDGIDGEACEKLKALYKRSGWKKSYVDNKMGTAVEKKKYGEDYEEDLDVRVSDIAWVNDQWVYDLIWPYMEEANKEAGWKYRIKSAESSQLTRYKEGGFYDFHRDGTGDHLSTYHNVTNAFVHGYVRKLSMTVLLNDDFSGGCFEFTAYSNQKCSIHRIDGMSTGSIIVFPSYHEHRVSPVLKGTRHSLVTWFLGPPFE
jgi:PKHD-type hydroxylase